MRDLNEYEACLGPLAREEVILIGAWAPGPIRDWRGLAISNKPLVSIVFLQCGNTVEWARSERPDVLGERVRLLLGLYDETGLDVQVNFDVGGGQCIQRISVESSLYRPSIPSTLQTHTAQMIPFCDVVGSSPVKLSVLFLSGADVHVVRNGLWHARPSTAEKLAEPLKTLLTYGRNGTFSLDGAG